MDVTSLWVVRYLLEVVNTRLLPSSASHTTPRVVVKMDIEGRELEVVPDLVMSGALSAVDEIHVDWTRLATTRERRGDTGCCYFQS